MADATPKAMAEAGAEAKVSPEGTGGDERSLTSTELLQKAVQAEEALAKKGLSSEGDGKSDFGYADRQKAIEDLKNPNPSQEEPEGDDSPTEEGDPEPDTEKDPDGMAELEEQLDAEGKEVPVRKSRLAKLLAKAHEGENLVGMLEQIIARQQTPTPDKAPEKTKDPNQDDGSVEFITRQIDTVRTDLKKAVDDFDRSKELELQEQLVDLKAEAKVRKARIDDGNIHQLMTWKDKMAQAESSQGKAREAMWTEDMARLAALNDPRFDLGDEQSPMYQAVKAQIGEWNSQKHPIMLRPDAWRMAVEVVARGFGVDLPTPKGAQAVPSQPKATPSKSSAGLTQKKNMAAIGNGPTRTGQPPAGAQEMLQKLGQLPPDQQLKVLSEVMEIRQKARTNPFFKA